jgi:hypothetical protein
MAVNDCSGVCSPHGSLFGAGRRSQVLLADTLIVGDVTFTALLDLSIRSSNHVSVDDCPALCNEGTTVKVLVCRHPDECEC